MHSYHIVNSEKNTIYIIAVFCGEFNYLLYLREKTVRRLNRKREKKTRLHFRSKYRIARTILEQLRPLLPQGWKDVDLLLQHFLRLEAQPA